MMSCEGIALLFLILAAVLVVTRQAHERRRRLLADTSRCAHCRYDLTGNQSGRCPECGLDANLIAVAMANEVRRGARRLLWLLTAMLFVLFVGLVSPGLALLAAAVCGLLWCRHLPRFAAWRCQVCGESLVGVGDGRCVRCGQTAGDGAERAVQAELRRRRRAWSIGITASLLLLTVILWPLSVGRRINFEFADQSYILHAGAVEYVTPAHEGSSRDLFRLTQEFVETSELSTAERYGLTLPRAGHYYGALRILVPLWVVFVMCAAVLIRSFCQGRRNARTNSEIGRYFVRFPAKWRDIAIVAFVAAIVFGNMYVNWWRRLGIRE